MIIGILSLSILSGMVASSAALAVGYSMMVAAWFYMLFGSLVILTSALVAFVLRPLFQEWQQPYVSAEK